MKKILEIKNEKAVYFVCIDGCHVLESYSLIECKKYLCDYLKAIKDNGIKIINTYDYFIGMYNIDID